MLLLVYVGCVDLLVWLVVVTLLVVSLGCLLLNGEFRAFRWS